MGQDISAAVGNPRNIKLRGVDVTIEGMTFKDLGFLQGELRRQRRAAILESTKELAGEVPEAEYFAMLERARQEMAAVAKPTDAEAGSWIATSEGSVWLIWTVLRRLYPDRNYTVDEAGEAFAAMVAEDGSTEATAATVTGSEAVGNEKAPTA